MSQSERTVTLGQRELKVLPLNLRGMRELAESGVLRNLEGFDPARLSFEPRHLDAVVGILLAVLRRGAPELTVAFVEEWIDVENLDAVLPVVLEGAGFRRPPPGEAERPKS